MEASFLINSEHKIKEASGDLEQLFGLTPESIINRYCYDVITSELCFRNCPFNYVVENRKPFKKDNVKFYDDNGNYREFSYLVTPMDDNGGISVKIFKNGIKNSDLKTTEEKNGFEKIILPYILDNSNDGIIIVDKNFRIIEFNKVAQELTGFTKGELYGQPCPDICTLSKNFSCPFDFCLKTNTSEAETHTVINRKNGEPVMVNLKLKLIYDEQKNPLYGIAILKEVVEFVDTNEDSSFYGIIGKSNEMRLIYKTIKVAALTHSPVLITGESGVGKELVASAIHNIRTRNKTPFIKINCAALPETLLESELFGYEKGAFTGATTSKAGKFELAGDGTILLDEISETTKTFQAKLLRVIQEREFERLGGNKPIQLKARIIATTNKNLKEEIEKDNFRADLFYRLSGIVINMPPLRERKDDIPLLAVHFLKELIKTYNDKLHKKVIGFSDEAFTVLKNYYWHGNVRELKNTIESIYFSIPEDKINIKLEDLPEFIKSFHNDFKRNNSPERERILNALKETSFDKTKAAEKLGMSRVTLWRKMVLYNINIKELIK